MMKSILSLLLVATAVSGFAPVQPVRTPTTSLEMGLFDGFMKPKKKEPEKIGGMEVSVFGGRGKKVTVREDEDNAMVGVGTHMCTVLRMMRRDFGARSRMAPETRKLTPVHSCSFVFISFAVSQQWIDEDDKGNRKGAWGRKGK